MSLFDLFRKKQTAEHASAMPLKKRLASMRCKRVNYVACDFEELCSQMQQAADNKVEAACLVKLTPVNYYALKDEYIEAAFYSDEEHEENYVIFRLIKFDKPVRASGIYPVSKDILRKAFEKLGAVSF